MKPSLADMVLEILKGTAPQEIQKKYYLIIKTIVAKKVRLIFSEKNYTEIEDLAQEITQDFFLWLLREDIKKKFTQRKERLTSGYLIRKINGLVIDYLRKIDTLRKYIPENLSQNLYNPKGEEDEKLTLEDTIIDKSASLEMVDWKITAIAFLNTLNKKLNEEQMRTFCHWIFRDKYSVDCFLESLSSSAKYKRVERLKKALKEILEKNTLDMEEWKTFIELMEIYCQKQFGKCV